MRRAGDSGHRGEGGDFAGNTGASGDEAVFSKCSATDDGRVGANGGAVADQCLANLILADNPGARVVHIGEHAGRAAESVVPQRHAFVDQDVVLDFRVVGDGDLRADAGFLADPDIAQYVAEMPDAGTLDDLKTPLILNRILLAGCWLRSPSTLMVTRAGAPMWSRRQRIVDRAARQICHGPWGRTKTSTRCCILDSLWVAGAGLWPGAAFLKKLRGGIWNCCCAPLLADAARDRDSFLLTGVR